MSINSKEAGIERLIHELKLSIKKTKLDNAKLTRELIILLQFLLATPVHFPIHLYPMRLQNILLSIYHC